MIAVRSKSEIFNAKSEWLDARWHFAFDYYRDAKNESFSHLRVFNNDRFAPGNGFPFHSHANMEIVTLVLEGELQHEDSLGNKGVLHENEFQVMTAGKGIEHSESNPSSKPLHLLQVWLFPEKQALEPVWEQKQFSEKDFHNQWVCAVSEKGGNAPLQFNQHASFYLAEIDMGKTLEFSPKKQIAFVFVIRGTVELNDVRVEEEGEVRVSGEKELSLKAVKEAKVLLLDLY